MLSKIQRVSSGVSYCAELCSQLFIGHGHHYPTGVVLVLLWCVLQGKLTVLLDLDGTLVSSFTPRRAPRLPPCVVTHVVGKNSALNPAGVFVVERPGLDAFLAQLSSWAEVIVFTAGEHYLPVIMHGVFDTTGLTFARSDQRFDCREA